MASRRPLRPSQPSAGEAPAPQPQVQLQPQRPCPPAWTLQSSQPRRWQLQIHRRPPRRQKMQLLPMVAAPAPAALVPGRRLRLRQRQLRQLLLRQRRLKRRRLLRRRLLRRRKRLRRRRSLRRRSEAGGGARRRRHPSRVGGRLNGGWLACWFVPALPCHGMHALLIELSACMPLVMLQNARSIPSCPPLQPPAEVPSQALLERLRAEGYTPPPLPVPNLG